MNFLTQIKKVEMNGLKIELNFSHLAGETEKYRVVAKEKVAKRTFSPYDEQYTWKTIEAYNFKSETEAMEQFELFQIDYNLI